MPLLEPLEPLVPDEPLVLPEAPEFVPDCDPELPAPVEPEGVELVLVPLLLFVRLPELLPGLPRPLVSRDIELLLDPPL